VEADQKQCKNRNVLNSLAAVIHKNKCNAAGNRRTCALEQLSDSTNADLRNSRTQMIFGCILEKQAANQVSMMMGMSSKRIVAKDNNAAGCIK